MEFKKDSEEAMGRITQFSTSGKVGDALVMINLKQEKYKVKGLDKWDFPSQMEEFLDEVIKALEFEWKGKEGIADDMIPGLFPRYGIAEQSAFVAGEVAYGDDTSWSHPVIHDYAKDLEKLELREDNTMLRMVIDGLSYIGEKGAGRFAIKQRGSMSPLDIANALRGNEIFTDLFDFPEELHKLLEFCTEACEWYASRQLAVIEEFHGGYFSGTDIWMPGNSIGHLSEDATVMCSPDNYKDFGKAYTEKFVNKYDSAFMHLHTAGRRAFKEILGIEKLQSFELAPDPNQPRGIEVYEEYIELFQNKVMKLFVNFDEIKDNLEFLKQAKAVLYCDADSVEEAKAITAFVRKELPVL